MSAVQRTSTATQAVVNASDKPSSTSDPPQRPPTTSAPRVRIEGVRGSNPLSSTRSCRSAATFGLPATCLSGGGCRRRADVSPRCLGYWPGPQVPIRGASCMRWTVHSEKPLCTDPWLDIRVADVELPDGRLCAHCCGSSQLRVSPTRCTTSTVPTAPLKSEPLTMISNPVASNGCRWRHSLA